MRIVIIGAGLGGLASAYALTRAGHDVTVFEKAERMPSSGYGLILWPSGTGILRDMGFDTTGMGYRLDKLAIHASDDSQLIRLDLDRIARRYGAPNLVFLRAQLLGRLSESLPDGCLRFGRQLVAIRESADRGSAPVTLSFADGSTAEADILIGADGLGSRVRRHLLGDDDRATYTGWATWHGVTRVRTELTGSRRVKTLTAKGAMCVMHSLGDDLVYWAFETPWKVGESSPPGALADGVAARLVGQAEMSPAANLKARFADFADPMPQLLDVITDDDITIFPHVLHRIPESWSRGRITLLGDALHAVPPRAGMGANQALEDAWVLTRAINGGSDPVAALKEYERARRRRVRRLYRYAARGVRETGTPPPLLRLSRRGVSITAIQSAIIKGLSNYLNER
ncbi:FAD-dependent urate hydroxylase [Micromonospora pisi]|uniref:FAD-dependent urate hydroxylase n=1 Tax=Micromonospora pisi TaxID=589240 RepID=A0A495JSF4_9ACTN|nr:NAD(P)/FAD-dependent oxidoreductase [Micromonospora pisi]RKR91916.1 FAD-dependent urate hydroxylase [Micromonospora pisi]